MPILGRSGSMDGTVYAVTASAGMRARPEGFEEGIGVGADMHCRAASERTSTVRSGGRYLRACGAHGRAFLVVVCSGRSQRRAALEIWAVDAPAGGVQQFGKALLTDQGSHMEGAGAACISQVNGTPASRSSRAVS